MNVCIFGCGPAGLLAAHAVEQYGGHVMIVSIKQKSPIPGAVFLHESIPDLSSPEPDGEVTFAKFGTREGYAYKVYGDPDAPCSWDLFDAGARPAWSMFALYDVLWTRFQSRIHDHIVTQFLISQIVKAGFDLIISTIPGPIICNNDKHKFTRQRIYVLNISVEPTLHNGMIYNGSGMDDWYRTSRIFGVEATEATVPFSYPYGESGIGYKPLWTDCDCHPEIERIGRFGRWEKGILVHHAYHQTVELMEALV